MKYCPMWHKTNKQKKKTKKTYNIGKSPFYILTENIAFLIGQWRMHELGYKVQLTLECVIRKLLSQHSDGIILLGTFKTSLVPVNHEMHWQVHTVFCTSKAYVHPTGIACRGTIFIYKFPLS